MLHFIFSYNIFTLNNICSNTRSDANEYVSLTMPYYEKYLTESHCSCMTKQFFFKYFSNITFDKFCSKLSDHVFTRVNVPKG